MHIYRIEFETPRGVEPYRDAGRKVVVPNPPESGGMQEAIASCLVCPLGLVPTSVVYSGPVDNATDWQHAAPGFSASDAERLDIQLAGCLTAAEGHNEQPANLGDYGHSLAYEKVLLLRRAFDKIANGKAPQQVLDE